MPYKLNKYTVVAYVDGERGCSGHVFKVRAQSAANAWSLAVRRASRDMDGGVSEQGVQLYSRDAQRLTEIVTFAGWPEEARG